jgi:hypothetical protein
MHTQKETAQKPGPITLMLKELQPKLTEILHMPKELELKLMVMDLIVKVDGLLQGQREK